MYYVKLEDKTIGSVLRVKELGTVHVFEFRIPKDEWLAVLFDCVKKKAVLKIGEKDYAMGYYKQMSNESNVLFISMRAIEEN